jgi:hypothetical protein
MTALSVQIRISDQRQYWASNCDINKPCDFLAYKLDHSDTESVTFIYFIKTHFSQVNFNIILKRQQDKRGKETMK